MRSLERRLPTCSPVSVHVRVMTLTVSFGRTAEVFFLSNGTRRQCRPKMSFPLFSSAVHGLSPCLTLVRARVWPRGAAVAECRGAMELAWRALGGVALLGPDHTCLTDRCTDALVVLAAPPASALACTRGCFGVLAAGTRNTRGRDESRRRPGLVSKVLAHALLRRAAALLNAARRGAGRLRCAPRARR